VTDRALAAPRTPAPALIVVAHGSRDPRAATAVGALAARIRADRAGVDVTVAYLEHARPSLRETLTTACDRGHSEAVVVPLLLTAAYHSTIDLPRQLAATGVAVTPAIRLASDIAPAGSAGTDGLPGLAVCQAPVLGPDPVLLTALERRIHQAGIARDDRRWGLVVAAAGSKHPEALSHVTAAAAHLHRRGWATVMAGYAAAATPTVPQAVAQVRNGGATRVAIASYLLTPGRFSEALRSAGADALSAPLGDTPEVADLVLRRYDAAARGDRVEQPLRPVVRASAEPAQAGVAEDSGSGHHRCSPRSAQTDAAAW
jgi:sirohydrochlorin ferrochelatase